MKRKILSQIKFSFIFSFISLLTSASFALFYQPVIVRSQSQISRNAPKIQIQFKQKQEKGDNRGRPTKRRGMGSRNDCLATNVPLTALIPENQVGKVVEANPTFWLYIPYKSNKMPKGEFVLQDEADNDVYRTDFHMNEGEGIVGINLASGQSLETNKIYQWYFKLYCDQDKLTTPIYVRGWVQRVALQPNQQKQLSTVTSPRQRVAFYAQNDIWYSALTELAKLRRANPQNKSFARDWLQLLNDIGLQDLSNKPIVGKDNYQ